MWSYIAKSSEDVTTGQCKVYEVTKLDHDYKDLSGYWNPTAEYNSAPHHKVSC